MAKDAKQKLIPFTEELEKAIEEDAERCRRSFVRQVEAVLMTYYNIEDVEVDRERFEFVGELLPKGNKTIKVLENPTTKGKRKAG
ncbi:MAG: hypothetical protein M3Q33_01405 [Acidobacteriota bacterium]|nr:hypothetical protein [Acidobacteriota bacterium]